MSIDTSIPQDEHEGKPRQDRQYSPLNDKQKHEDAELEKRLQKLERSIVNMKQRLKRQELRENIIVEALISELGLRVAPAGSTIAKLIPLEEKSGDHANTILSFGGMSTGLSLPVAEFMRTLSHENNRVLFIKDFHQAWHLKGLRGISSNLEGTLEFLHQLVEPYQPDCRAIGTSAGGFAAILFGVRMGVRNVVAFAPQTHLTEAVINRFRKASQSSVSSREILSCGNLLDLRNILTGNQQTRIEIHYGASNREDSRAAEWLQGYPGIVLKAHPCDEHSIARWLKNNGLLTAALNSVL
jgi:hypothetical protein